METLFANDVVRQLVPFPAQLGSLKVSRALYSRVPSVVENSTIEVPLAANAVYPLLGGTQLLIQIGPVLPSRAPVFDMTVAVAYYLAGMDDNPFVAPVSLNQFKAFRKGGEQAFYEALKPAPIKMIESLRTHPVRRQGDIWAIKIGKDWEHMGSEITFPVKPRKGNGVYANRHSFLLRTRHKINGEILNSAFISYHTESKGVTRKGRPKGITRSMDVMLGKGIITAPDHPDLDISDGVYVIARTSRPQFSQGGMD